VVEVVDLLEVLLVLAVVVLAVAELVDQQGVQTLEVEVEVLVMPILLQDQQVVQVL
jgi:hypothetical protein